MNPFHYNYYKALYDFRRLWEEHLENIDRISKKYAQEHQTSKRSENPLNLERIQINLPGGRIKTLIVDHSIKE